MVWPGALFVFITVMELSQTSTLSSLHPQDIRKFFALFSRNNGVSFLDGKKHISSFLALKPMHLRGGYLQDENQLDDKFGDRELSELHYNIGKDPAAMASR